MDRRIQQAKQSTNHKERDRQLGYTHSTAYNASSDLQVLHLCMEVPLARNTTHRAQDWRGDKTHPPQGLQDIYNTKRERPTAPYVSKWLDFYHIYTDELLFIYDAVPKANYPFDILIDDAPKNLIDVISPKSAILFNQPWNKNFNWPVRVNSLSEAEKLL